MTCGGECSVPPRDLNSPAAEKKPLGIFDLIFITVALLAGATAFFRPIWDPDTFWHLAVGREITREGRWVTTETFSFTASGEPWEDSEWLFHAFFYPLWKVGGDLSLSMFTATFGLLILLQLWRLSRLAGSGGIGFCLTSLLVLPVLADRVRARPDLFSILFLGVLAEVLWRYQQAKQGICATGSPGSKLGAALRLSFFLFFLFALWANLHGGWAYGLALLGAFATGDTVDHLLERSFRPVQFLGWAAACSAAVAGLFATPYTWKIPWFPFKTLLFLGREGLVPIQEWNHTPVEGYRGALLILSACFAAALLLWRAPLCASIPAILQVFLSFWWVRYPPFGFYLLAPLFLAFALRIWRKFPQIRVPARTLAAACAIALALFITYKNSPQAVPRWDLSKMYPAVETDFLRAEKISGNIVNPYEVGGYLDWYYYPLGRIFMDGRYFPFVEELGDYFKSMESVDGFRHMLDRRGVDIAIHPYPKFVMHMERPGVPPRGVFHYFFPKEGWAAVCYGNYGGLFLRRKPEWAMVIATSEYRVFSPDEIPFLNWASQNGEADGRVLLGEIARYRAACPRNPFDDRLGRMTTALENSQGGRG